MATSRIEEILERQAKSWEMRRKLAGGADDAVRDALLHLTEGPWLSISRQQGSWGLEIARAVGERMHWQVYDREILRSIAEHTRSRERVLAQLESEAIGPFRDYITQLIVPGDPGRAAYLKEMTQVVWGIARQGQAVIVGRGANWFLGTKYGLRVRVVAPLESRIARLAAELEVNPTEARRRIAEHDARRLQFVRQTFNREIDDPLGYDLVLNTRALSLEAATDVVLVALRRKLLGAG